MTFPVLQSVTATSFGADATSHAVAMPAVTNVDDLLLVAFSNDNPDLPATPSGWSYIGNAASGGAVDLSLFGKIADGTEGGTTVNFITSTAQEAAAQVFQISGWYGGVISGTLQDGYSVNAQTGLSAGPDSPWCSSPGGLLDLLWITIYGADGHVVVNSYPTDFENPTYTSSSANAGAASIASATFFLTADQFDPPAFTIASSEDWVAATIAIRAALDSTGNANTPPKYQRAQALSGGSSSSGA